MKKDIKRTDNKILPDTTELSKILKTEAEREVPVGKKGIHYPVFDTVIKLFSHYGLPTQIFTDDSLDIYQVHIKGRMLLDEIIAKILKKPMSDNEITLFNQAYDYLAEEDNPKKSDIIFVFGAKTPLRAEKAAELYHCGLGKRIMVSGGHPIYNQSRLPSEAKFYKEVLIKQEVPEDKIIVENKAITVPDNVYRSLNLLDKMGLDYKTIILINSPYT